MICEIDNRANLSEQKQEKINEYLTKLARCLNKKEENYYHDCENSYYYGKRDIESLSGDVKVDGYYKPIVFKTAFEEDEEDESG